MTNEPKSPQEGEIYLNVDESRRYVYTGTRWVQIKETNPLNTFSYQDIYERGEHVYPWEVNMGTITLSGSTCGSVSKVYRDARKAVKRHRKMMKFLNPGS